MANDFIFGTDGHVGLSHRKAGELLGVSRTSVWDLIKTDVFTLEEEEDVNRNGIRGEALAKICTYYSTARRITPQARQRCKDLLRDVEDFQALIDGVAGGTDQPQETSLAFDSQSEQVELVPAKGSDYKAQPLDFIFGSDGHAGLSQRKAAELLKVDRVTVSRALKGGDLFSAEESETVAQQGIRGGDLVKLAGYFSQARRVSPETKQHCVRLLEKAAIIGIQTFIDRMAGIKEIAQPQQPAIQQESTGMAIHAEVVELRPNQATPAIVKTTSEEIRKSLFDIAKGCVEGIGVHESIERQYTLQALGTFFPEYKDFAQSAINTVRNSMPLPDNNIPLIPTEIAKRLNGILRRQDLRPWHINDAAREMGWQTCQRIKDRNQWELTEEGQKWAVVVMWADVDGHSGPQIKWYQSAIPEFVKYFRGEMTGN